MGPEGKPGGAARRRGRTGLIAAVLVVAAGAVFAATFLRKREAVQPIAYNHKKHLEQGLACDGCHEAATTGTRAGIPPLETCMTCHADSQTGSPEEAKLREYGERGLPPPWVLVSRMPDHVYFSHRRHVALAKLDCGECHGAVAERTVPFGSPPVDLSMDFCVRCHESRRADTDCLACHR